MKLTHRFRCVYDPEIQRGVKETKGGPKEFLREKQLNAMAEDIMANTFECPQLMWDLRAGETIGVYLQESKSCGFIKVLPRAPIPTIATMQSSGSISST